MQRYILKWVTVCVCFTIPGCTKNFLDRTPLTLVSTTSFWKTEKDMETALTGCYALLNFYSLDKFVSSVYFPGLSDALSDDGVGIDIYGVYPSQKRTYARTGAAFMEEWYTRAYQAIASTNNFLANVDRIENIDAAKKARAVAEVKFLRAYQYYRLAITFGNVPLMVSNPVNEDLNNPPKNASRPDLLVQINKDINDAIEDLPEEMYNGHVGKAGAQLLKMHVLMVEQKFNEAATIGASLYNSSLHSLAPVFYNNFIKPGQINNPEILFSIKWNPPATVQGYTSLDYAIVGGYFCTPSGNLVNDFETINGKLPVEDPNFNPVHPYQNRDPRLKQTVFCPGDYKGYIDNVAPTTDTLFKGIQEQGLSVNGYYSSPTGFRLRKFLTSSALVSPPTVNTISSQDWVVFRYADALLLYAEALNESSPGHADIASAVNKVRTRVGMPVLPLGLSQTQMRERIRRERRVELAFENIRYFDLRRWGIAESKLNGLKLFDPSRQATEEPNVYKSHYEYWPIPLAMYNRNKNLVQNPGYPPFK